VKQALVVAPAFRCDRWHSQPILSAVLVRVRPLARVATILCVAACSSKPAPPPPPSPCTPPEPLHTGEATHYAADGTGNCSFEVAARSTVPAHDDRRDGGSSGAAGSIEAARAKRLLVAAINEADYQKSARCGSCLAVVGADDKEVVVEVVDRCPGCKPGDLDLSRDAFALLAPLATGRIPIRWRVVPCEVEGPLVYHFKPNANADWMGIQLRNHRHPIAGLDVRDARGTFTPLPRADYNYFIGRGLGSGPFTLRVRDARGQMHVETGVPLGGDHTGSAQLPRCP
jgi:expansin (peptidoglycan-binding protein)